MDNLISKKVKIYKIKSSEIKDINLDLNYINIFFTENGIKINDKNGNIVNCSSSFDIIENSNNTNGIYKLDITYNDNKITTPNLKGLNGFSPNVIVNPNNTETEFSLVINNKDSSFITPNLKGSNGKDGIDGKNVNVSLSPDNDDKQYKLVIENGDTVYTTPNLKGSNASTFTISKKYNSIEKMLTDESPVDNFSMVIVIEDKQAYLYLRVEDYIDEETNGYMPIQSLNDATAIQGEKGEQGLPGKDGLNGKTPIIDPDTNNWIIDGIDTNVCSEGKDGLSAYEIAKKNGFIGTEQEWLDKINSSSIEFLTEDELINLINEVWG